MARLNKTQQKIKDLLSVREVGDLDALKKAIWVAQANNIDPTDIIDTDTYLSRAQVRKLTPEEISLLESPPEFKKKEIDSIEEAIDEMNADEVCELAQQIFDPLLRLGTYDYQSKLDLSVFQVVDNNDQIVTPLATDKKEKRTMNNLIGNALRNANMVLKPNTVETLKRYWELYSNPIIGVTHCSRSINDDWTFYRSPWEPNPTIPWDNLRKTVDRLSEPDAFGAYIWGVYSGLYKGRQVLWLEGTRGEEGKSFLLSFLGEELFGMDKGCKAISNNQIKYNARFFLGSLIGAKLAIYPDCNNTKVLLREDFKSLSGAGRDPSLIEKKFQDLDTARLVVRVAIASNFPPFIKNENWLLSRLFYCQISPFKGPKDPYIADKWRPELPGFLAWAEDCYNRLAINDETIQTTPQHTLEINRLLQQSSFDVDDVILRNFTFDPEGKILLKDVDLILRDIEKLNQTQMKEVKDAIRERPGVVNKRSGKGGTIIGLRERKDSDGELPVDTSLVDNSIAWGDIE